MKKLMTVLGLAVLAVSMQPAKADVVAIDVAQLQKAVAMVGTQNLIDWKVGDASYYDVTLGMFGKMGKLEKSVTKDEGAAIWVRQYLDIQIQKDTTEILLNKADGRILKMIHNGKEEAVPESDLEIISQDTTEVTVPAGTFDSIHIVAKTKDVEQLEVWMNPRDTVMDGTLKQFIKGQFDITLELNRFTKK